MVHADLAGVGHEVVGGVLGGHTGLDGVAVAADGLLRGDVDLLGVEGIALGDEDLGADDVHVGDKLGDGVLHLDSGVHLDEVGVAVPVHQELTGAGVAIAHGLAQTDGAVEDLLPGELGHGEGGGVFNDFLVPALHGAVTVEEVNDVAVVVGQDLDLHMLGALEVFFDEDLVIAEGLLGLVDGFLKLLGHVLGAGDDAHAASAAAVGGLEHDGVADLLGHGHGLFHGLHGVVHAGDDGHVGGDGDLLGGDLVAHGVHALHGGADEDDAVLFTFLHQDGVLGQEAIAGVDGVHVVVLGDLDDGGDVQIGVDRALFRVQGVSFVRQGAEHGVLVFLGVDGHRGDAQLVESPEHADGDLSAVCHQNSLKVLDTYFTHKQTPFYMWYRNQEILRGRSSARVYFARTNVFLFVYNYTRKEKAWQVPFGMKENRVHPSKIPRTEGVLPLEIGAVLASKYISSKIAGGGLGPFYQFSQENRWRAIQPPDAKKNHKHLREIPRKIC